MLLSGSPNATHCTAQFSMACSFGDWLPQPTKARAPGWRGMLLGAGPPVIEEIQPAGEPWYLRSLVAAVSLLSSQVQEMCGQQVTSVMGPATWIAQPWIPGSDFNLLKD